jgi:3-hydroxyisobutyrate dehydrogenase
VSGTVGPAREGKLLVLAGGSDGDIERVRPVLSLFARRIAHVGPIGSGISMKIALQLPIYAYWQSLAECLSIGARSGLAVSEMLSVIADSPAALAMLKDKIPVILQQDKTVAFAISAAAKDLAVIDETAKSLGVHAPATAAALSSYGAATVAGWGALDVADLIRFLVEAPSTTR